MKFFDSVIYLFLFDVNKVFVESTGRKRKRSNYRTKPSKFANRIFIKTQESIK